MSEKLCSCGSGLPSRWQYDARGIELCRTCDACHEHRMSRWRPDVLTDPNYPAIEEIDGDPAVGEWQDWDEVDE